MIAISGKVPFVQLLELCHTCLYECVLKKLFWSAEDDWDFNIKLVFKKGY